MSRAFYSPAGKQADSLTRPVGALARDGTCLSQGARDTRDEDGVTRGMIERSAGDNEGTGYACMVYRWARSPR